MIYRNGQPFNISLGFEASGVNYPPNWYYYGTDEEKERLGFTIVTINSIDNNSFYYNPTISLLDKSIEECQKIYELELASTRWGYENAGIIYNDILYTTDSDSKLNYLGAMQRSVLDPTYTVRWKARTVSDPNSAVFVNLSASDMINIASFAISYITACFEHENNLLNQINNTTSLQELTGIDLKAGWPSQYYS